MLAKATLVAADTERVLLATERSLDTLIEVQAAAPSASASPSPGFQAFLRRLIAENPPLLNIGLVDARGNFRQWAIGGSPPNVATWDYFAELQTTPDLPLFIGLTHPSRLYPGKWVFSISRALPRTDGKFQGVAVAVVDVEHFIGLYRKLVANDDATIGLTRADGTVMVRTPDHHAYVGRVNPHVQGLSAAPSGQRTFIEVSLLDGVERVIAERRLSSYPLVAVATVSLSSALAHWYQEVLGNSLLAFLLSLAAIAGARLVDGQMRRTDENEERLRQAAAVFSSTQEGVVITDLSGQATSVNPAFCAITGYDEAEVLGRNMNILRSGRHDEGFYADMWRALAADGLWQGEIWNRRKDGEIYPEWLSISSVRGEDGKPLSYVGTFIDISRIKQSEFRLEQLAYHDPLTGLPNRLMLMSRLEHAVDRVKRHGGCAAVLFCDLDHFKTVNDSLGHSAGDGLLQMAADCLRRRLREADTLARIGGDEFVVVLEDLASSEAAANVAQSLIDQVARPFLLSGGQEVYVGLSVGISIFPSDGQVAGQLLQNADAALYQAKAHGRGTYRYYTEALTQAANTRLEMEAKLRHALERQEFVLHYQPVVALEDGRIRAAEALVRWQPDGCIVPPGQFITLAEETGVIIPLGEWVLRAACLQMKSWLAAGLDIETMAVNLSPLQFRQTDLEERIAAILAETGLPAANLELEITESALMEKTRDAETRLAALKAMGVRLAIDDFGTGYSSLAYLKRFPLDKLKIDRSFVQDIPDDPTGMEIAAAVMALGQSLRLEVVAEGIEEEDQLTFLAGLGCNLGQGFLFSRPKPAAEMELLLRRADAPDQAVAAG